MRTYTGLLMLSGLLSILSCGNAGIIDDVRVKLVQPNSAIYLETNNASQCSFPEVLHFDDIRIVSDSILVVQDQPHDGDAYYFKAYSLNSFDYLGSFVLQGRGPDEMLAPYLTNRNSEEDFLFAKDNSVGQAYMLDVQKSLQLQHTVVAQEFVMPTGSLDWLLLPESKQFVLQLDGNETIYRIIGADGKTLRTALPYSNLDGERFATHLSSIFVNSGVSDNIAEIMLFLPQINIFADGRLSSVAVNKSYKKWESIINRRIDLNTVQYYASATSNADNIFAVYKELPLSKLKEPGNGSSIHVFDWKGNFIYNIEVAEDIGKLAFDSRTKNLYCIDESSDRVVCYDLHELIP